MPKYAIINSEEEYEKFLKSERALIKLLSFVSAICVLICVFGFVSLVSLTCEERRKEIAIRKINGATAGDILSMFAKEYFLLLIIGAVIAFTAGRLFHHATLVGTLYDTDEHSGMDILGDYFRYGIGSHTLRRVAGV